jgi:hypothetical protein
MVYDTRNYWVLGRLASSCILMFRKLDVCPSSILRSKISGKNQNENQYKINYINTNLKKSSGEITRGNNSEKDADIKKEVERNSARECRWNALDFLCHEVEKKPSNNATESSRIYQLLKVFWIRIFVISQLNR